MFINKTRLLLLIIGLALINCSIAESIECYRCNSTDSNCGNRIIDSEINKIECQNSSKCIAYSRENTTFRGCANELNISKPFQNNGCFIDTDNLTYCFCDSNKCNGASLIELKDLALARFTQSAIQTATRRVAVVNSSVSTRAHFKPTFKQNVNYRPIHKPSLSKNLFKKLTSLRPSSVTSLPKKLEPKVYQLKINDSFSKETFRKRFSLKPEQKLNIVFVKIPVYNNIMNEQELIKKYSINNSNSFYVTYYAQDSTTITTSTTTRATTATFRKPHIMKNFSPAATSKRSLWVMKNMHRKEYNINFKCPANGLFPHPLYCNKFIQCLDYGTYTERWYVQSCPEGLFFNYFFKYCDYITNVRCSYSLNY